mmetsp:Transcript_3091/g.10299  ORF Transcript_3091/g.10299 Transcript_3091/m.10299 type:complete len:381 (-) Transcript_3091:453-1595(-)
MPIAKSMAVAKRPPAPAGRRSVAGPDREVVAGHDEVPAAAGAPVVAAHLHGNAVPDNGRIEPSLGLADLDLRRGVDARVAPDAAQLQDLLADLRAPHVVVVEDAGHAGVREEERVGTKHLLVVAESTADDRELVGVVVVDERHGTRRVTADDAAEAPVLVELREVVGVDDALQHVVQREVVDGHAALALPDVVVQAVGVAVPVLRHGEGRTGRAHVVLLEVGRVALHEVEAQRAEAHVVHHVPDVGVDVLADLRVRVVHAGRVLCGLSRATRTRATRHRGAVAANGPALPVRLLEAQPATGGVLRGRAAVVHHDVQDGVDLLLVHRADQALQRRGAAVAVVQDVPLPRQVGVLVHGVRGRGQPHHVHARGAQLRQEAQED